MQAKNETAGSSKKLEPAMNNENLDILLDAVDELTFLDENRLVGATAEQILKVIPPGLSLKDVEDLLYIMEGLGVIGIDNCRCGVRDCKTKIYFRTCPRCGVPMLLHDKMMASDNGWLN